MNNAKIWLVVKPTVGIPIFLSAVAISSFAVHLAVVTNTSWVSDYLSGQPLGTGDQATAALETDGTAAQTVSFVRSPEADGTVYAVMPDGSRARLVFEDAPTLAAFDPGRAPIDQ
jgi:light-harvesting protein B-800-850 alpha chain